MDLSGQPILVAGGGIAGLTAALALMQRGARVTVLEQARKLGEVGAGISLGPTASRSLYSLGLKDAILAVSDAPRQSAAHDYRTGEVLDGAFKSRQWSAADLVDTNMLHRADLHAVLSGAILTRDPTALRLAAKVVAYRQDAAGVTVTLADGSEVTGAALVACDGLHSAVRAQMVGPEEPRRTGRFATRFLVPVELGGRFLGSRPSGIFVGPRVALLRYVIRKGTLINCVAFAHDDDVTGEGWDSRANRDDLLRLFDGWHESVRGLARCAPLEATARWALYDRDPLDKWTDHRVVLAGDAAHPLLPFLGFGAALAIEDAVILARAFDAADTIEAALTLFEATRVDRAREMIFASRRQGEVFDAGPQGPPPGSTAATNAPNPRPLRFAYDPLTVPLGAPANA